MKRNKFDKIEVHYPSKGWEDKSSTKENPMFNTQFASKMVVRSHTKRYHNCLYILAGLSSCARDLMDFITEQMDDNNVVNTNEYFRGCFMEFIDKQTKGQVTYCDSSVKRALTILTQKKLVRHIKRGYSVVNAEYFWKNDDKNRHDLVKLELRFESGYDTEVKAFKKKHKLRHFEPQQ